MPLGCIWKIIVVFQSSNPWKCKFESFIEVNGKSNILSGLGCIEMGNHNNWDAVFAYLCPMSILVGENAINTDSKQKI